MAENSIVLPTCEISADVETAVELGTSWGVREFELKTLGEDHRVPEISEAQRRILRRLPERYGMRWRTLSPGLFIRSEARPEVAAPELGDRLPRTVELAQELGADTIIIFSFRKTAGVGEAWVVDQLRRVVAQVEGSGLQLVLEPLAGTYADSAEALRRLLLAVASPALRANWDPGNVAHAGFPAFPDGYARVRDLVGYVHLKNLRLATRRWMLFDQGDLDLRGQVEALLANGYRGPLAVESHIRNDGPEGRPPVEANRHNTTVLRRWLTESTSESPP